MMNHESRLVAIESENAPLAIMHYTTVGRGDFLPTGAQWIIAPGTADPLGWWHRPVTDEHVFAQIVRQFGGNGRPMPKRYVILPERAELPADRDYRNAWCVLENNRGFYIGHDLEKAKDLHRAKLREARAPLLAAADVDFMRALEAGADPSQIVASKKALREITADPAIAAARTIEELKAVTLGIL